MSILGGGWERVVYYDSKVDTTCPGSMLWYTGSNHHLCTNLYNHWAGSYRAATYYPVTESYSQVRGFVRGYAYGNYLTAFVRNDYLYQANLDYTYMTGIDIMYEEGLSYKYFKHIHSFVVSDLPFAYTPSQYTFSCYIAGQNGAFIPAHIGNNHYCHSLSTAQQFSIYYPFFPGTTYFGDNWDGTCTNSEYCRDVRRYFIKTIPKETISADHRLLVRVMAHPRNIIAMSFIDVYVR